jgi:hypothetical protein
VDGDGEEDRNCRKVLVIAVPTRLAKKEIVQIISSKHRVYTSSRYFA